MLFDLSWSNLICCFGWTWRVLYPVCTQKVPKRCQNLWDWQTIPVGDEFTGDTSIGSWSWLCGWLLPRGSVVWLLHGKTHTSTINILPNKSGKQTGVNSVLTVYCHMLCSASQGDCVRSKGEELQLQAPLDKINLHLREGSVTPTQVTQVSSFS